jgi:hypothetical protein
MGKKVLIGVVAAFALVMNASAAEYDLKNNMDKLNTQMQLMQTAFIIGNKEMALKAANELDEESKKLLGDETVMRSLLPKDKEHKVRIALTSAHLIDENVAIIKASMDNIRRETAQNAYLDIQRACMRCHNLVRDW